MLGILLQLGSVAAMAEIDLTRPPPNPSTSAAAPASMPARLSSIIHTPQSCSLSHQCHRSPALGYADKVSIASSDKVTDPLPTDCDVHLFPNVFHDWMVDEDKRGPFPVAGYSALLRLYAQGKCYAFSKYREYLTETGCGDIVYPNTVADRVMMTSGKPR
jgi:hypothetical protein